MFTLKLDPKEEAFLDEHAKKAKTDRLLQLYNICCDAVVNAQVVQNHTGHDRVGVACIIAL